MIITCKTSDDVNHALATLSNYTVSGWDSESAPIHMSVATSDVQRRVENKERALDPLRNRISLIQASTGTDTFLFDNPETWPMLKSYLEDPHYTKLGQNLKFDWKQFKHHLGIEITNVIDTMLVEKVLTCGQHLPASLERIAMRRLRRQLNKKIASTFTDDDLSDEQEDYAAADVEVLFPIFESQKRDQFYKDLQPVIELEMDLMPVLADMELTGFLIDQAKWRQLLGEFDQQKLGATLAFHDSMLPKKMRELFDGWHDEYKSPLFHPYDLFAGMSPSSNVQLKEVMNLRIKQDIRWEKDKRVKDLSLPSTSTKDFAKFRAKCREFGIPIPEYITTIVALRRWEKLISSFGENLLNKIALDGKLHPTFNQIIDTGRTSCNNPNLQQMPKRDPVAKKIRSCFMADPGYAVVKGDYSQIELRILADFAKEPIMIDAFLKGLDLHKRTASIMTGIPIDKVDDTSRTVYKSIGFGIPYGLTDSGLALRLDVPKSEATKYYREYLDVFQTLKKWIQEQKHKGIVDRVASTALGRIRYLGYVIEENEEGEEEAQKIQLNDFMKSRVERQAVNSPIQGTSADMIKRALVSTHREYKKHGIGRLALTVHDEIVGNVKDDRKDEGKDIMTKCMLDAGNAFLHTVPCAVEVSEGIEWS